MQPHPEQQQKASFFQVGTEKMIELTLATFGLYALFWTYANWQQLQRRGEAVNPLLRTLLAVVYQYDLYRRIHQRARIETLAPRWSPLRIYLLFVVFTLMPLWLLVTDHPWGILLSLMTLLPNLLANQSINQIHDKHLHFYAQNTELSGQNWAAIVIGLVGWLTLLTLALTYTP